MKALVTECAGFIGSSLTVQLLAEGYSVIGISCFTDYYPIEVKKKKLHSALQNWKIIFLESDLLCIKEFPDVDYVFHQVALVGVRASWWENFDVYTRNNVLVTQRLLEYYKDKEIKKNLFASSSSIYGDIDELPINEDAQKKPVSSYGVTKSAAENLYYLYHKNYGLPAISLRYFTVYGPQQQLDMALHKFITAALNRTEITVYGDGNQTRDFSYFSDIIKANIKATKFNLDWGCLNVGDGSRISANELFNIIEKAAWNKINLKSIQKQKEDVKDTHADISLTKEVIEY